MRAPLSKNNGWGQQFSFWLPNRLKAELQTLRGAVIRRSEFRLQPVRAVTTANMEPLPPSPHPISKKEMSRNSLEAHRTLMDLNPANIPKFKDVAQFLAEDLKRLEADAS